MASYQAQVRAAQRAEQITAIEQVERQLVTLHHEEFKPAQRPILPLPPQPDLERFVAARVTEYAASIGPLRFAAKKEAKQRAARQGPIDAHAWYQQACAEHAEAQHASDEHWNLLIRHDQAAVTAAFEEAFEDNQSPAACVDVDMDNGIPYATLVVVFGPASALPEQRPALTPAGMPTLKKRTKTDRNSLYAAALGSSVLATVKEAFAVAPSVTELRVLVIRRDPEAPTPADYIAPIYAARFGRQQMARVQWERLDPAEMLLRAPDALLKRKGSTAEIVAIDLRSSEELAPIMDAIRSQLATAD